MYLSSHDGKSAHRTFCHASIDRLPRPDEGEEAGVTELNRQHSPGAARFETGHSPAHHQQPNATQRCHRTLDLMKILVRDSKSGLYLGEDGSWMAEVGARQFLSVQEAGEEAWRYEGALVVLSYDDPRCELSLSPSFFDPKISRRL